MAKSKQTSPKVAKIASKLLRKKTSSPPVKKVSASALAQAQGKRKSS